ncbi:MAG: hypothetical protein AB7O45_07190 [Alphaproteobacteria bacterium]
MNATAENRGAGTGALLIWHSPVDTALAGALARGLRRRRFRPTLATAAVDDPALAQTDCVVLLLSSAAEHDPNAAAVVDHALAHRRPLLPIRIDGEEAGPLARRLSSLQPLDGRGRRSDWIARAAVKRFQTGWGVYPPIARPFRPLGMSPLALASVVAAAVLAAILVLRPFDPAPLRPADLRAGDFAPAVADFETDGARGRWRIEIHASPRLVAADLLDDLSVELSIDGTTFEPRRFFPAPIDGAATARALHLRLVADDGTIVGPFGYPMAFAAEARARMKQRIEEGGWTRCSRATCFLRFMRDAGAIRALRWGFDDGPLDQRAEIDVPDERLDDLVWVESNARIPHQIILPRGAGSLRFQVLYFDGSEGKVQREPVQARP